MKKIISKEVCYIELDQSVEGLIEDLKNILIEHSQFSNIRLNEEACYEGGYKYTVMGDRLENDAEESARISREEEYRKIVEANERATFEKLKVKFS